MANYNNEPIKEMLLKCWGLFTGCFITMRNELILHPKHNIYMRLDDLTNELDFKVRAIQSLSRDCCKGGLSEIQRKMFRLNVNKMLEVDFSQNEWSNIYTYCNDTDFIKRFVNSGYNLEVIKEKGWYE